MTSLRFHPALERLDLVAGPVAAALRAWPQADQVGLAVIDPSLSDTAALVSAAGLDLADCANCVVVGGRRDGHERVAAAVVLATTRLDVNRVVRKLLDVRKASFLPMDTAVGRTGMEYGAITPIGLPSDWLLLVDHAVLERDTVIIGAGLRAAKLRLPGSLMGELPGSQVIEALAS